MSRKRARVPGLAGRLRRRAAGGVALLVLTSLASLAQLPWAPPAAAATTPTTMAAGWTHSCLIRSGKAYCWGDNTYGELGNRSTVGSSVPVPVYTGGALSGVTLTQVSAGNGFTCALSSAGAAYCWGAGNYGELGVNSGLAASSVPVAVSTAGALSGVTLSQISAGQYHACAVSSTGAAYCWGWNAWGQLGNNSTVNSTAPVAVTTSGVLSGITLTQVAAGGLHSCALSSTGKAYCWGGSPHGELGNNATTSSSVPVAVTASGVLSGVTLTGITAGYEHTCALASGGAEYCWGSNGHGELGIGSGTDSNVPAAVTQVGVSYSQISAGNLTSCALSSAGAAYCWGRGTSGELGNNTTSGATTPSAVSTSRALSGKTVSQISAGAQFTCALDTAGGSYCWGIDANGQLGNPATSVGSSVPEAVTSNSSVTISAGQNHACAINPGGVAYCWGDDTFGELGNGTTTTTPQTSPVAVSTSGVLSGVTLTQISAGTNYTCALSNAGTAYCWGQNNTWGQLGNNSTSTSSTPVAVSTAGVLSGVKLVQISAGNQHACALSTAGAVYCWGYDLDGELGNNSLLSSSVPVAVSTAGVLSGVTIAQVSVEHLATCAVGANGAAYCWGYDLDGELGNNSLLSSSVPVAVSTAGVLSGKFVTQVAGSALSACAIDSTGKAYCWGSNTTYGQLGNGSTSSSSVPVAVTTTGALSGVTLGLITAGAFNGCAVSTAGASYCWGNNADGEFGSGNFTSPSTTAVATSTSGVLSGQVLSQITGGYYSTCAAGGPATIPYCWGQDTSGQLGNTSTSNSNVAVVVLHLVPGAPTGVVAVPADTSLTVYFTAPSILGAGTLSNYTVTATPGAGTYPGTSAPTSGSCTAAGTSCTVTGLTNGAVYLVTVTTNTTVGSSAASAPASGTPWPPTAAIAAGYTHSCTISGGKAYCWGDDTNGELGNNTTTATPQTTPVAVYTGGVLSGVTLTQITTGNAFTCALSSAGAVYCWGLNTSGQLGNNSNTQSQVPVAVTTSGALSGVTVTQVSAGYAFACATGNGASYCWGTGGNGELGNNSTGDSSVPVSVSTSGALSGVTVTDIAAGNLNACVLGSNGAAYCWGFDFYGELGNSSNTQSQVPVAVTTSGALSGVSLTGIGGGSTNFMCALSSTGQSYCWGGGGNGQLGNNSTSSSNVPVAVVTSGALYGTAVTSLTTGVDHACALSLSGAAYCWGDDTNGELGNNTTTATPQSTPVAAYTGGLLSGVTLSQISGGQFFTCARDTTPYAYCWGLNGSGQLGSNSTTQSTVAVYVAPQAPTGVGATMTPTTAAVSWTAPVFTNSGTITGYTATASPGSQTCTTTSATSCTITGLTPGTTYTITVTVTASPTGSATSSSISAMTTILQMISPSSLTWSLTGNGLNQAVADQVSGDQQFTVTDTTGSGAGWHLTVSVTTPTSGTHTLPDSGAVVFTGSTSSPSSTSAPTATCAGSCTLPANATTYPVSITTAASPAIYTIYDTQASSGLGQMTIGGSSAAHPAGWWVNVPGNAHQGSYAITVTLEVISGP
jgi:alpha-tubulin suppressor-like RCC1 family protein